MQPVTIATRAELEAFLAEHPHVNYADAVIFDLCGVVRGKRYPRDQLVKLFESGLPLPYTVYLLDVTGDCCDPGGRGFSDGDPDGVCWPLAGTLKPVGGPQASSARVLVTMRDADGRAAVVEPRNVLRRVVERFAELGLHPVLACELEFYLLSCDRAADGRPQTVRSPLTGAPESDTQVYGLAALDVHNEFFQAVRDETTLQGIPATVASAEFAPAQFEINLHHVDDALVAADHCALLRHVIVSVAHAQGCRATFASKPFAAASGSGMHVHLSLLDASGGNVLDDGSALGSAKLRHAVGGLLDLMYDAMPIFASNVNAYRRFRPQLYVPVNRSWGANNRSVALRIPAGESTARRIEHRVPGADANPYLVLAAILSGVHHGIANELDPCAPADGNACDERDPEWPRTLDNALDRLDASTLMRSYLGDEYVGLYCATKRAELEKFYGHMSPLEYEWYL